MKPKFDEEAAREEYWRQTESYKTGKIPEPSDRAVNLARWQFEQSIKIISSHEELLCSTCSNGLSNCTCPPAIVTYRTLIEQRQPWDCAICAYAMYLGKTYEEIFKAYGDPAMGYPVNKSVKYLWSLKLDVEWFEGKMPEKRAVVVVNSKNYPDKWHSIYYDGEHFFDPSPKEKYYSWFDVKDNLIGVVE